MATIRIDAPVAFPGNGMALVASEVTAARVRMTVLPPIRLTDGTVEGLKWLGLALMTLDHVNKHLLQAQVAALFDLGRLALPLFGLVLAYNLARPGTLASGVYSRTLGRLALVAAISEIPFIGLGGLAWGWYPFNILAMLLVAASVMWLIDLGGSWRIILAALVFIFGGAMVEFWWPGVALCVAAWAYCRRPTVWALLMWVAATVALYLINHNFWALAAFPLIFYAPHARWQIPRVRWAFYVYYPVHLAVLWGVASRWGK